MHLVIGRPGSAPPTPRNAARQAHLQQAETDFEPLPFDAEAARAFGQVAASLRRSGRMPAARAYDAMIAAVAIANELPSTPANPSDFKGIDRLDLVPVPVPGALEQHRSRAVGQDGRVIEHAALAALPRVDALVEAAEDLVAQYGRAPATDALRRAVDGARRALLAGEGADVDAGSLVAAATLDLARRRPGPPRPVLNAAGIVVHTNLGRAPLSAAAREAMLAASDYCDLEYDLDTGRRGSRDTRLGPPLVEATGAEAGIAVNNAAAALVLILAALATGREVPVSRGELVEIGGSFRLPEIMAASGARLVEVGTTN
ncbi:MAG: hypothetical protein GEU81_15175, partial [Nitriliruptorales bacterium]|nr:hypothetical protein [Nitriliruptorales bacterium]